MKLSVIVPVYNVEKFLPRCLDSLLRQGMEKGEFEVICVNDGSPDNSSAILTEYEARHPDIFKVITQENQGLGGARNTGMAVAIGEYVTFVDSDDYVIDNAYLYLYEHFCDEKPDVLAYDNQWICTNGKTIPDPDAKPRGDIIFEGGGIEAYNRFPMVCVWSKFYKRTFLQKHCILSKIVVCQDEVFNFDVFRHNPYTIIVDSKIYRYELGNENSIQRTIDKKDIYVHLDQLFQNINIMTDYLQAGNTDLAPAAQRNINNFLNVYHQKILKTHISWSVWKCYKKKMNVLPPYHAVLRGSNWGARMVGKMQELGGKNYVLYSIIYFLRSKVFAKIIRPLLLKKQ